jgi:hypothetical protein
MNRLARLATIVTTFAATMALSATAALAYVPPPRPTNFGTQTIPAPTIVHTTSSTGVGAWAVLLIALGAVVVGAALTELFRAANRRHHGQKFATA